MLMAGATAPVASGAWPARAASVSIFIPQNYGIQSAPAHHMKVLVTGGSGVVGLSAITALLERGHTVRLLSRGAEDDSRGWASGVEAWSGDICSPASIEGSANGCEAVLHLIGIV